MIASTIGVGAFFAGMYCMRRIMLCPSPPLTREDTLHAEYHGRMTAQIEANDIKGLESMLVRARANPSLYENELLWWAAACNNPEAVKLLLSQPSVKDQYLTGAGYSTGPPHTAGFMRGHYCTPYHCASGLASLNGFTEVTKVFEADERAKNHKE
jgi:hypothetical protein